MELKLIRRTRASREETDICGFIMFRIETLPELFARLLRSERTNILIFLSARMFPHYPSSTHVPGKLGNPHARALFSCI